MKIETEIKKWGNSLTLRVSGVMAELPGFSEGTRVSVDVSEEGLIIKAVPTHVAEPRLPYSEKALLAGLTPETAHADELALPTGAELGEK
jgi:antitoxin MazE